MICNVAEALDIDVNQVNIKATTTEGLGFAGEGLGIEASAVCLLASVRDFDDRRSNTKCNGCSGCQK